MSLRQCLGAAIVVVGVGLTGACGARSTLLTSFDTGGARSVSSRTAVAGYGGYTEVGGYGGYTEVGGYGGYTEVGGYGGSTSVEYCTRSACTSPPPPSCTSGGSSVLQTWSSPGICQAGICSYPVTYLPCALGCTHGHCLTPSKAVAIAGTDDEKCVVTSTGKVECWGQVWESMGSGASGVVGEGLPVEVAGLPQGMASVSVRGLVCAIDSNSGVWCWRAGNYTSVTASPTPLGIVGLSTGAASVSAGGAHACALTTSNTVKCWGQNSNGQLGDGTTTERTSPVAVVGLPGSVVSVCAGGAHSCAVAKAGGVYCWGDNTFGALGTGGNSNKNAVPTPVVGLSAGAAAVSCGENQTCALMAAGNVKCWGPNTYGQLGSGTYTDSRVPVDVQGMTAKSVSIGSQYTCAVMSTGGLRCWGRGFNTIDPYPTDIQGLSGVIGVSPGTASCAVTYAGTVWCWGTGNLGNPDVTNGSSPVEVRSF